MPEKSKNNTAFNADQSESCFFAAAAVFYNLLSDMYYLCILTKKPPCILLAYSICMYSSMKYQICTVTIFHLLSTTYAGFLLSSTKKGIIKFNAEKFEENSRITGGNTILLLLPLHCLSWDSLVGRWSVAIKEKASVFPTLSSSCSSSRLSQYSE